MLTFLGVLRWVQQYTCLHAYIAVVIHTPGLPPTPQGACIDTSMLSPTFVFRLHRKCVLFVYCFHLIFCFRACAGSALHGVPEGQDRRPSRPPLRSSQTGQGFVERRNPPRRPSSLVSLCSSVSRCKNHPTMILVFNSLKCAVAVLLGSKRLPSFPA